MEYTDVGKLSEHVGETVTVAGWCAHVRSSGKVAFVVLRDGTGTVQCVFAKGAVSDEAFDAAVAATHESSLWVRGEVRADGRAPGGFELQAGALGTVGTSPDFPIGRKDHGVAFLMERRHLWLRSSRQVAIMRVRDCVSFAIRRYLRDEGFVLIDTPILTGAIGEEAGTLFSTEYFDLGDAYLAQTGQLYAEAGAMAHRRVYCFGPTFRAEKSKTRRHLTEFWMIEPEVAFSDQQDNMALQERFVSAIVKACLSECKQELETLERDVSVLESVEPPFPRLTYDEAVERLKEAGSSIEWGDDLGAEDETILSQQFEKPLFVWRYPRQAKAFYMKVDETDDRYVLNNDLLAPEGYGEIIGGSQREDRVDVLMRRIAEQGLSQDSYEWYIDLRRFGGVPHSGFGLGLERTVAWICGVHHVRECIPFPRTMARLYP